jgi:mono/diheme cytochrome c family protein
MALAAGALVVVSICQAPTSAQGSGTNATVLDGVYTGEQARRGQRAYDESCGDCHQRDLSGGDRGPALAGEVFLNAWLTLTVGDLFERVRTSMPADSPGSLSAETTADIVAFMLQANDYPAGSAELRPDLGALKGITIANKN